MGVRRSILVCLRQDGPTPWVLRNVELERVISIGAMVSDPEALTPALHPDFDDGDGPDGSLGVCAEGGSGVHITFNVSTPDAASFQRSETQLTASLARRHLIEIPKSDARPGDVLVFRYHVRSLAKHAAMMAHPTSMIHALEGAPVCEVALSQWWRRHLAAAFAFPRL